MSRTRFGERRASTANCSSSGLRSRSRASPSTWSSDAGRLARDGAPFCVTTRLTLPPWTCSEAHLRRILRAYARYYNDIRTHRSLDKDAPVSRPVQRTGIISSHAILGGLHHYYARVYVFGTHRTL